jgi:hypothetical protein
MTGCRMTGPTVAILPTALFVTKRHRAWSRVDRTAVPDAAAVPVPAW